MRRDAVQKSGIQFAERGYDRRTEHFPDQDKSQRARHHVAHQAGSVRTQCRPDRDLAAPCHHRLINHAVNSSRRQDSGTQPEPGQENHVESMPGRVAINELAYRGETGDSLIGIHLRERPPHQCGKIMDGLGAPDDHIVRRRRRLCAERKYQHLFG